MNQMLEKLILTASIFTVKQVEKQEKPKKPCGRARQREKYNRRFVHTAVTGGKRKVRTFALSRTGLS